MVSAWLFDVERVFRGLPWTFKDWLVGLLVGGVVVVLLELLSLLLRVFCCLVTSAVRIFANSLIWRSFQMFVSSLLLHSKMKWPSESATVGMLQHGQPSATILLPIGYLRGSRAFCWRTLILNRFDTRSRGKR